LRFSWQNTAISGFKMCPNSTFWLADLNGDHPYLPIKEKNTCFDLYLVWMKNANSLFRPDLTLCTKKGSKWKSGRISGIFDFSPGPGNRSYWGVFDHIFSNS
jgi:hypothetical protein